MIFLFLNGLVLSVIIISVKHYNIILLCLLKYEYFTYYCMSIVIFSINPLLGQFSSLLSLHATLLIFTLIFSSFSLPFFIKIILPRLTHLCSWFPLNNLSQWHSNFISMPNFSSIIQKIIAYCSLDISSLQFNNLLLSRKFLTSYP